LEYASAAVPQEQAQGCTKRLQTVRRKLAGLEVLQVGFIVSQNQGFLERPLIHRLLIYRLLNLNADEDEATVYTANPVWIRKMDKLCKKFPEVIRLKS